MLLAFDNYFVLRVICWVLAWFIQMGLHEGAHAITADRLGDSLPRAMGKVTVNPIRHVDWHNTNYVLMAVVMPIVTAAMGWIPMGMAYVYHSRMSTANEAKIAIAGPIGSFAGAILGFVLWIALFPLVRHVENDLPYFVVSQLSLGLVLTSLVYGFFNLIPVPPLDGGTVAYHYLNHSGRRFFDTIRPYGFFILIAVSWTTGFLNPFFAAVMNFGQTSMIEAVRFLYG